MRFYWNLDDDSVTTSLGNLQHLSRAVRVKGGQRLPLELQFHRQRTPERLEVGTDLLFGLKPAGKYEDDYLTSAADWTRPDSDTGFYTATVSTNTDPIRTALALDADPDNDVAAILAAIAEFQYLLPAATLPSKSRTFTLQVDNFVNQGDEADPDDATPFPAASLIVTSRPAVTGLTGGGASKLDGLATIGLLDGAAVLIRAAAARLWTLERIAVVSSSVAAATVITTAAAHGLATGDTVDIGAHTGSTPAIDGTHVVTVLTDTTFSIPVTVTVAGADGYVTAAENSAAGLVRPDDFDAATNAAIWKSVL